MSGGSVDATNLKRFRAAKVDAVGSRHFSKYEAHDLSLTSKSRAAAASAGWRVDHYRTPDGVSKLRHPSLRTIKFAGRVFLAQLHDRCRHAVRGRCPLNSPSSGGEDRRSVVRRAAAAACQLWAWGSSSPPCPRAASPGVLFSQLWRAVFLRLAALLGALRLELGLASCFFGGFLGFFVFCRWRHGSLRAVRFGEYRCAAFQ